MIELTIDGTVVSVPQGTTIFDAARLNGIAIPTLCHQQNENPVGVCRVCVVDLGQRVYAASCIRQAEPGMKVQHRHRSGTERSSHAAGIVDGGPSCSLRASTAFRRLRARDVWLRQQAFQQSRFPRRSTPRGHDDSSHRHRRRSQRLHPVRPLRPRLRQISHNYVIAGWAKAIARIAFDPKPPMGDPFGSPAASA